MLGTISWLFTFASFAVVELCQTALAGFTETVVEVDAGFVHGAADHIIADIPGAGEEITEIAGIHGAIRCDCVALDAGNLHQTADGIAGQTQVMLHSHFCGIFYLIQILSVQLSQCGSSHGTGGADFSLAAALRTGDGCVSLGQVADDAGGGKTTADLLVGIASGFLGIAQHSGQNTAGTAGGCGDNRAVVCILLGNRIGISCDLLEFQQRGDFFFRLFFKQIFCLALYVQAAGQNTLSLQFKK